MNRFSESSRFRTAGDDLIHVAIRLGLLALLLYWSFTLVRPFIPILAWALVLAVALYPVYDWLAERLGNRRRLAALVITLASFAVVVGPTIWLGTGLAKGLQLAAAHFESGQVAIPRPPDAIREWPVIGERVHDLWAQAAADLKSTLSEIVPSKALAGAALAAGGSLGAGILKFFAALVLTGFLFAPAPHLVNAAKAFLLRVIPQRSEEFVALAGATIRSVSQGVIGLSILYALLTGLGLQLAGVPGASTLAFVILLLNILQIGPLLVTIPVVDLGLDGERPNVGLSSHRLCCRHHDSGGRAQAHDDGSWLENAHACHSDRRTGRDTGAWRSRTFCRPGDPGRRMGTVGGVVLGRKTPACVAGIAHHYSPE